MALDLLAIFCFLYKVWTHKYRFEAFLNGTNCARRLLDAYYVCLGKSEWGAICAHCGRQVNMKGNLNEASGTTRRT